MLLYRTLVIPSIKSASTRLHHTYLGYNTTHWSTGVSVCRRRLRPPPVELLSPTVPANPGVPRRTPTDPSQPRPSPGRINTKALGKGHASTRDTAATSIGSLHASLRGQLRLFSVRNKLILLTTNVATVSIVLPNAVHPPEHKTPSLVSLCRALLDGRKIH